MFRLNRAEIEALNRSQFATGSQKHRDPRYPPFAFTEHGALMAASVLNTPRAIEMSVFVIRAFVRLRQMLASHEELARKVEEMEQKYDKQFAVVFDAIKQLIAENEEEKAGPERRIGFRIEEPLIHYGDNGTLS